MDPHSEQQLLTAISNYDVGTYEALIQGASAINNITLLKMITSSDNVDAFRAVLKHSSVNPFYDDNHLIRMITAHNLSPGMLAVILEHPMNQLTADHYHAFISLCDRSQEMRDLLHSYLNKQ
jgi:hypothetical protein